MSAARTTTHDLAELTAHLYGYGSDREVNLASSLGPRRRFGALHPIVVDGGWSAWRSHAIAPARPTKLYVGCAWAAFPEVAGTVLRLAGELDVIAVKLALCRGRRLRPDRLVVYLDGAGQRDVVAHTLLRELAGIAVHPVPFTARLEPTGLLSWSVEPPGHEWPRCESWRRWVCANAALAMAGTSTSATAADREAAALGRLQDCNVDPDTWTWTRAT